MSGRVIQGFFAQGRPTGAAFPAALAAHSHRAGTAQPARAGAQPAQVHAQRPVVQRLGNGEAFRLPQHFSAFGNGVGQPLPLPVREQMEAFFKAGFADVRVHTGPKASMIGALAFTQGSNVYFAPGQYNPNTVHGRQLLGHELAHVVQQRAGRVRNPFGDGVAIVQDRTMEAEAQLRGQQAAAHQVRAQAAQARSTAVQQAHRPGRAPQAGAHTVQPRPSGGPGRPNPTPAGTVQALGYLRNLKNWATNTHTVSLEMSLKIASAQRAIDYVKPKITHGPQNQIWARQQYGDQGDINMGAMVEIVNQKWNAEGGYDANWTRARRVAAAVAITGGGNCQDVAALTYNFLREDAPSRWTVCLVVARNTKHAFATIGVPGEDPPESIAVADAWVRYPKACRFSEHFCRNDNNLEIIRRKSGGKAGRMNTLTSKYWGNADLDQYAKNWKNYVEANQQRSGATWNHEYVHRTYTEPTYVTEPPPSRGPILPL